MNRRLLLLGLLAAGATPAFARQGSPDLRPRTIVAPAVAPAAIVLQGQARTAALARANSALNSVQRLQGRFLQSSPDGVNARGRFFLERPGRLRFQYDPPSTLLIVSDGRVVSMRDTALRTTERTPLRSTPPHRFETEPHGIPWLKPGPTREPTTGRNFRLAHGHTITCGFVCRAGQEKNRTAG